jgi:hypothetical protein
MQILNVYFVSKFMLLSLMSYLEEPHDPPRREVVAAQLGNKFPLLWNLEVFIMPIKLAIGHYPEPLQSGSSLHTVLL